MADENGLECRPALVDAVVGSRRVEVGPIGCKDTLENARGDERVDAGPPQPMSRTRRPANGALRRVGCHARDA